MSKVYEALMRAKEDRGSPESRSAAGLIEAAGGDLKELQVFREPDSPLAETFRFLRTLIVHPLTGTPPRTILVTSALPGEGKTFVSCNLAVSLSQGLDDRVLLIDADLRDPRLHLVFGVPSATRGLSTILADGRLVPELIRETKVAKLSFLPAGAASPEAPAELVGSERMKGLVQDIRAQYPKTFIIIDSSPLELTAESSVLANAVDAVLLVVRHGQTPRSAVKAAASKIRKENLLGVVYNGYDEPVRLYEQYGYSRYGYERRKRR